MSINILDLVKDQVTGSLAKQASEFLGESESGVTTALGGLMPAILGGAIEKASSPEGGQGLMDMIGGLDLGKLGDIAGIFGGGAESINNVMNSGGGIIESLLGGKSSGIIDMIAGMAGLKKNSTGSLLKMAAPFLMGLIGNQIKGKGLGALTDLIMGQKDHVANAMPSGMGSLLGFTGLGDIVGGATDAIKDTASAATVAATSTAAGAAGAVGDAVDAVGDVAKSTGNGLMKWLVPIVILAGLAFWFFNKGGDKMVTDGMETVGDAAADATGAVGDAASATLDYAKDAFGEIDKAGKAALDKITFTAGSAGSQIMNFIKGGFAGDGTFKFQNLNFPTGSADLSEGGQAEVDNLAAIMIAYPGVNVEVHGHTDNTGDADANLTISSLRAGAVMGRLIAHGIDASRVKAMGFGSERPVADNGTEEGQAQNRRTEVKIVK
jgi:outer membrane protein OmpA-like peptidoglycan-associated protein